MPDLSLTDSLRRLATMRADALVEPEAPPAPDRWSLDHLEWTADAGGIRAQVTERWHAENPHGTACARCAALHGDVREGGRVRPCPSCAPVRDLVRRVNAAGLPASAQALRAWSPEQALAPLATGAAGVERWFASACDPRCAVPSLALTGPTGRGKTCVALGLTWRAIEAGTPARWTHWPTLLDAMRQRIDDARAPDPWHPLRQHRGLVILDDFGRDGRTAWARAQALRVFESVAPAVRLIVTTNAPVDDWPDAFGDAAASRLLGRCARGAMVLTLTGSDLRRSER